MEGENCQPHSKLLNTIRIGMAVRDLLRSPIWKEFFGLEISYKTLIKNWLRG
jgi:hypothetical protein